MGEFDVQDMFMQGSVSTKSHEIVRLLNEATHPPLTKLLLYPYPGYEIQVTWKGFILGGSSNREQL